MATANAPRWTTTASTGRGAKGVINVKTTERNGKVVAILLVSEESEAMLISQYGKIIRMGTDHIREAGRATQGVRLLQLEGGRQGGSRGGDPEGRSGQRGADADPVITVTIRVRRIPLRYQRVFGRISA